jgi:hypothetical protein
MTFFSLLLPNFELKIGLRLMENITIDNWTLKGTIEVFKINVNASFPTISMLGDVDEETLNKVIQILNSRHQIFVVMGARNQAQLGKNGERTPEVRNPVAATQICHF